MSFHKIAASVSITASTFYPCPSYIHKVHTQWNANCALSLDALSTVSANFASHLKLRTLQSPTWDIAIVCFVPIDGIDAGWHQPIGTPIVDKRASTNKVDDGDPVSTGTAPAVLENEQD